MMKKPAAKSKTATQRSSLLIYATVGTLFPVCASLLDIFIQGLPLGLESLLAVQATQPLHWIIDCVPVVIVGLFALQTGNKPASGSKMNAQVEQRATERVAKLTRTVEELKVALSAQKDIERELRDSEEYYRKELETVQAELDTLKKAPPAQASSPAFTPAAPSPDQSAAPDFAQDFSFHSEPHDEAQDEEFPHNLSRESSEDQDDNDAQFSFSDTGLLRVPGLSPASETPAAAEVSDSSTQPQPFDLKEALARVDGDHELLTEMAELFLEESPRFVKEIQAAVESGDTQTLTYAAHTLKGSVGNFAATEAAEAARQLEQMGRKGDLEGADMELANLEAALARLTPALTELSRLEAAA